MFSCDDAKKIGFDIAEAFLHTNGEMSDIGSNMARSYESYGSYITKIGSKYIFNVLSLNEPEYLCPIELKLGDNWKSGIELYRNILEYALFVRRMDNPYPNMRRPVTEQERIDSNYHEISAKYCFWENDFWERFDKIFLEVCETEDSNPCDRKFKQGYEDSVPSVLRYMYLRLCELKK